MNPYTWYDTTRRTTRDSLSSGDGPGATFGDNFSSSTRRTPGDSTRKTSGNSSSDNAATGTVPVPTPMLAPKVGSSSSGISSSSSRVGSSFSGLVPAPLGLFPWTVAALGLVPIPVTLLGIVSAMVPALRIVPASVTPLFPALGTFPPPGTIPPELSTIIWLLTMLSGTMGYFLN